jgi:hypothetical protein
MTVCAATILICHSSFRKSKFIQREGGRFAVEDLNSLGAKSLCFFIEHISAAELQKRESYELKGSNAAPLQRCNHATIQSGAKRVES